MLQLIILLILLWLLLQEWQTIEPLRIHGSYDIRGDPYIPYNPSVSPWNVGTSLPTRRRRMVIGDVVGEPVFMSKPKELTKKLVPSSSKFLFFFLGLVLFGLMML